MKILGISAYYHDSAAVIVSDGKIIAAAQEERFTRVKHDPSFPVNAVKFCLKQAGCSLSEIDALAFYDKPWLKFERLMMTYYVSAPKGVKSFINAAPVWMKEKLFLKKVILDELAEIEQFNKNNIRLLFPEHHLSHAASAYYPSPFADAAVLTIDGVGEWTTASICHAQGKDITVKKDLHFPHSVGLLYSAFTYYLGFKVNSGEYKLMGLAPYGNKNSSAVKEFKNKIVTELVDIKEDGSLHLNQKYFNYLTGDTMTRNKAFEKLFGLKKREPSDELLQIHCDMALAAQQVTEDIVLKMAAHAAQITGSKNICLAGGVALNCVSNAKLLESKLFENVWVCPASGDAGGALGAALAAHHIYFGNDKKELNSQDALNGAYLGTEYCDCQIEEMIKLQKANAEYLKDDKLFKAVASYIAEGKVVGWFSGKMEYGPRALGARSILGDARSETMQERMNVKIKFRESFRPFAPSVLEEKASEYFEMGAKSLPYMLVTAPVKESIRFALPDGYENLSVKDKLYYKRSSVPAVTHIDYSARVQTVSKETNPRYHALIEAFESITGCPVIINTSFNVRGEPIVNTPLDAYRCFMRTDMDILVIENFVFIKENQPKFADSAEWQREFVLD
ncbi:MAG: carbamoyltransferase [Elusimicrobia bacterium]|nr:carbamoyltransferase [Elusimicrobiota bacterium]